MKSRLLGIDGSWWGGKVRPQGVRAEVPSIFDNRYSYVPRTHCIIRRKSCDEFSTTSALTPLSGEGRREGKHDDERQQGRRLLTRQKRIHAAHRPDSCSAIVLPGRKSGFRAGFRLDSTRESFKIGPLARPMLSQLESGRNSARKSEFWTGSTFA